MIRGMLRVLVAMLLAGSWTWPPEARAGGPPEPVEGAVTIRVATFNLNDVRTDDLLDPMNPRLRRLAQTIQRLRPNVILLTEIAYDMPGAPGVDDDAQPGQNARRFAESFLAAAQAPGLRALDMAAFMAPVNTGIPSGHDLDLNGKVVMEYPTPPPPRADGTRPPPSEEARAYGNDCHGFGTFPGQYGMALLVDRRLEIVAGGVRTFRLMPWDFVPGGLLPSRADGSPWFTAQAQREVRLSSKSHWDVPVRLPNGAEVHFLCSHPTPPVFDGPENRNGRRNHDEIRFWADYIENASYIVDDQNNPGGLDKRAHFVILGDLNADPEKGDSFKNPIATALFTSRRLHADQPPTSDLEIQGLSPSDTALFKLRVDYVLPSRTLGIVRSGVWRHAPVDPLTGRPAPFPSDHFPVWMEIMVP
ncbi:MAG: endonuclease/exonuclease/phosphatase family protein [Phycisphaeraceae bacterium]|nr:endonuclease/exonuclease/phosphatase family protein [Phycisphaerae bacterium]MBX3392820.1 endonuclease/exonuclease/phosphatase family protein [Phycisphaeraceae bacterium]